MGIQILTMLFIFYLRMVLAISCISQKKCQNASTQNGTGTFCKIVVFEKSF